jgi:hypothetical protein
MAAEGRRGRRDNGLDAVAYVPLLDVDPRVGEHLLDVLGSAGVPAYLEPSADVDTYTRALSLPSPPTDRLFVDRDQRRQARQIVDAETPHGPRPVPPARDDEPSHGLADADEERAWQEIVAAFDAPPAEPPPAGPPTAPTAPTTPTTPTSPPTPPAPPLTPPADGPGDGGRIPRRPRYRTGDDDPGPPTGLDDAGWFGEPPAGPRPERDDLIVDPWSDLETGRRGRRRTRGGPADADPLPSGRDLDRAAEDRARHEAEAARRDGEDVWIEGPPTLDGEDEHFQPPPPPPFPRPSRNTVLAVLLLLLGITLMAVPQVIGMDDRTGLTLGVLSVLAGGVLLVLRMREARDEDGPDDGAVV